MAKTSVGTKTPSRIRLVVLEAELGDSGDVSQIAQALTTALRSTAPATAVKRIAAPATQVNGTNGAVVEPAEENDEPGLFDNLEEPIDVTPAKAKAPRKAAPTPDILPVDFNAYEVPLAAFVAEYKLESHQARYLVASAWFHEHGGVQKVTPSHIYSAYRWLKWPLTVKDFAQPLRDLKAQQLATSPEKGSYTLHHVGLQRVAELKSGKSTDAA